MCIRDRRVLRIDTSQLVTAKLVVSFTRTQLLVTHVTCRPHETIGFYLEQNLVVPYLLLPRLSCQLVSPVVVIALLKKLLHYERSNTHDMLGLISSSLFNYFR